ncbi:hypothetical protein N7537_011316 [Penicillium hordei]|uniref:Uncharacterized protein n=1 Tax=Penicillium hordei TaxID=40994 RepID=A0AAD6DLL2_9EURO|nr:uncharacterized protein N7537_011316 [Penicillium hordei]KAJ5588638.1 hypothetical protein N7537_011316 [Penicillium hordei]
MDSTEPEGSASPMIPPPVFVARAYQILSTTPSHQYPAMHPIENGTWHGTVRRREVKFSAVSK